MKTREQFQQGDAITWLQVHNLLPIVVGIISVVTAFGLVQSKVELNSQSIQYLQTGLSSCTTRIDQLEKNQTDSNLKIRDLEGSRPAVKGASVSPVKK